MEKYPNEQNQPETAYETPKLYAYLRELSQAKRHVMRTDATEQHQELGVILEAIMRIEEEDPDQYQLDIRI